MKRVPVESDRIDLAHGERDFLEAGTEDPDELVARLELQVIFRHLIETG